jgi:hypothetical protein
MKKMPERTTIPVKISLEVYSKLKLFGIVRSVSKPLIAKNESLRIDTEIKVKMIDIEILLKLALIELSSGLRIK